MSISPSKIDYLTHVWNPVVGCNVGCEYCWARVACRRIGKRIGCKFCETFTPHVHHERMKIPGGRPKVIGLGLMTDLFAPCNQEWERATCQDEWYMFGWTDGRLQRWLCARIRERPDHVFVTPTKFPGNLPDIDWPKNWWVPATCTNQAEVDERVPQLLRSGVKHPWLNLEPLVERVRMDTEWLTGEIRCDGCGLWHSAGAIPVDRVHRLEDGPCRGTVCGHYTEALRRLEGLIVGGMSRQPGAPEPVPMHPDWVRSLRDQCDAAGVPFYLKQWGAWAPVRRFKPECEIEPGDVGMWLGRPARIEESRGYAISTAGFLNVRDLPASRCLALANDRWMFQAFKAEHPPLLDGRTHRELPGRWGELMGEGA